MFKFIFIFGLVSLIGAGNVPATDFTDFKAGFNWLINKAYSNSFNYITKQFLPMVGDECALQADCNRILNSHCKLGTCKCRDNFFPDFETMTFCKANPTFGDICHLNGMFLTCDGSFQCINSKCACPDGTFFLKDKCVMSCPKNYVTQKEGETTVCLKIVDLHEECTTNDQCSTAYSTCSNGFCTCISGTNSIEKKCVYKKQCPVGELLTNNSSPIHCSYDKGGCPKNGFCQKINEKEEVGYCCPNLELHCPVGIALPGVDCTSCPLSTHHCFEIEVGTKNQSLCCPNECSPTKPIKFEDKCYPLSSFSRPCQIDQQCGTIKEAVCVANDANETTCQCKPNYVLVGNECVRRSVLGENCDINTDCENASNTICANGVCKCPKGFIPEPQPPKWHIENPTKAFVVSHCIKHPSCPTVEGTFDVHNFSVCSDPNSTCLPSEFCYNYWKDLGKNINYSICCPAAKILDYEDLCKRFNMKIVYDNVIRASQKNDPIMCVLPTVSTQVFGGEGNQTLADVGGSNAIRGCPSDSQCIFNPYSIDEGICCKF
uniref:EB domain-containing protein n=1 Tax=Rhabditophanes sp. KR3021 TaxID=114890 RepID=A0AC35TFX1_9BILA